MTPARIRRLILEADARVEKFRAYMTTAMKEAAAFRELLRLHSEDVNSTVASEQMQPSAAESRNIAISQGVSGRDPFLKAIRAKGYTLRSLADVLGCKPSLLSMQRSGQRPIPYERARKIEKLTGWPAAAKDWPGGLS